MTGWQVVAALLIVAAWSLGRGYLAFLKAREEGRPRSLLEHITGRTGDDEGKETIQ